MATDVEALMLRIEASATKLEKDMAKANKIFDAGAKRMEMQAKKLGEQVGGRLGQMLLSSTSIHLARLGGLVTAAFSADKVIEASQAYLRASNALKVTGVAGGELAATFAKLYGTAQANGAPIETLVGLYSKAAQAQKTLGASQEQLFGFTTAVAQSLRVSGQSAEQASGALLQLGQAISGTNVQAEEYNSLIDGAYPLLQAAAAGIREAGGDVAKLTQLVKAGEVSSKAFFYGVLAGAPTLTDKLAGSTETVAQAWTKVDNALIRAVGELDAATGSTTIVTKGLESLIPWIEAMPTALDLASDKWARFKGAVNDAAAALNHAMGIDTPEAMKAAGLTPARDSDAEAARDAIRKSLGTPYQTGGGIETDEGRIRKRVADAFSVFDQKTAASVKPVSLKDYPADKKKTGSSGGDSLNEYDRAIRKSQEQVAALKVEEAEVGKTTYEREKARKALELETAAKRAGIAITPDVQAAIDTEAEAYARAKVAVEAATEAHRQMVELQRFAGEALSGFFSDIVSGGKNAEEALMNLTKKLADAAFQAVLLGDGPLAGLFGTKSSSGGTGGLIGMLFKGLGFAGGGYTGDGGRLQPAGLVHRGEYVFDAAATRKIGVGNLEAMRAAARLPGFADGGLVGSTPLMPSLPSPADFAGGGSRRLSVTIVNNAGARVEARERRTAGGTSLDILVDQAVAAKIGTPGSDTRRAMAAQFGLRGGLAKR